MEAKLKVGDPVIYLDGYKKEHHALLTAIWGINPDEDGIHHITPDQHPPSVNLIYVSEDNSRQDTYGRQIERKTSEVHISLNSAGGNCWKLPNE